MPAPKPELDLAPRISDEVRKTTCYMCACRCGIDVHLKDGIPVLIEGNRDHPVNRGVLCAKGAAGLKQVFSPARLEAPMKRVGRRGENRFEKIGWDEALELAVSWMKPLRERAPEKLAFFTGRDQSQSLTSWWAQSFGTPNYAAHGGFCSVNMAAAGIYTMGGSFWEFGQPDWERTKLLMLFGVAEDHDSNPIKIGLGQLKARGARVIGVNPIRTGYNAIADDWVGITPGTDGLFILALVHVLLKAGRIDLAYLAEYTNAPVLLDEDGLFRRDASGRPLVRDRGTGRERPFDAGDLRPDLRGPDTVFTRVIERYLAPEYAPEAVAERCGVSAVRIREIAAELARVAFDEAIEIARPWTDFRGRRHASMTGRPVSFHAMRGISAHANGFQTCRALHLLQILLGTVEVPGGFRFKPPYPKPAEAHPRPHAKAQPGAPLEGPHLGFVQGPEDLALTEDGAPARIDKAFSWEAPMSAHGLMHMVLPNARAGDPYRIDTLFLYMANMAWNSSMNPAAAMEALTETGEDGEYAIPHVIYSDAYASEMVAYADLVLPDTTYLERHDCISLLDRPICEADAAADAIRWPVIAPDRPGQAGVRGFQSVLIDLGARLGLPGFVDADGNPAYRDYADYMVNHQRRPGVGPLAGWRGAEGEAHGRGAPNPAQLDRYIENGGVFMAEVPEEARFMKPWNRAYQDWAVAMGFYDAPQPYLFQLYVEPMRKLQRAGEGHGLRQPPEHLRARIAGKLDPLPIWYESTGAGTGRGGSAEGDGEAFPLHALTQRPMAMYHSWGSQNAWLRQIHGHNPLFVPLEIWQREGFEEGDWARLTSPHGEIVAPAAPMAAVNRHTVWTWNAIGKRAGAWALSPDAPEAKKGFLLNHLIGDLLPPREDGMRWANSDPVTGQAAWFDLRVRVEKTTAAAEAQPAFPPLGPRE